MKKLLLLLVITSFSLTAQINVGKISLDFGETTSEKDGEIIIIAGEKNGNIYALARRKKDFYSLGRESFFYSLEIRRFRFLFFVTEKKKRYL